MKIVAILGILVLAAVATVPIEAQTPTADRPVWQVGDAWTYRTIDTKGQVGERVNTVVKAEPFEGTNAYFVEISGAKEISVFDENINVIAFIDAASGAVIGKRTGIRYWTWPLGIGNSWSYSGTQTVSGRTTSVQATVTVEAYEDVTVPAGSFAAFRTVVRSRITTPEGRQFDQTETYWWASAAGNSVKYSRVTSTGLRESRELLRYAFAGAK